MAELRQRNTKKEDLKPEPSVAARAKAEDSSFSFVDVARTIVFVVLLSSAASYFVTRDSLTWNLQRPSWTRPDVVRAWINGPKQYTDAELKDYDGTDPEKPILLAINGTVYDVTPGRKHYGPGGGYHFFAGADASRAFVTSCFAEDISPDMRGVETMHLPIDDPEIDSLYTSGQLKALKEQERRRAREEVHKQLKHWVDFFASSKKYSRVGTVKREPGWDTEEEPPKLCESAEAKRPKRKAPQK